MASLGVRRGPNELLVNIKVKRPTNTRKTKVKMRFGVKYVYWSRQINQRVDRTQKVYSCWDQRLGNFLGLTSRFCGGKKISKADFVGVKNGVKKNLIQRYISFSV